MNDRVFWVLNFVIGALLLAAAAWVVYSFYYQVGGMFR